MTREVPLTKLGRMLEQTYRFASEYTEPVEGIERLRRQDGMGSVGLRHVSKPDIGFVYFVQADTLTGPIKIGTAYHLGARLRQLNKEADVPLCLIGSEFGGRSREQVLHVKFSQLRLVREWFRPEPDLLEYISQARFACRPVEAW